MASTRVARVDHVTVEATGASSAPKFERPPVSEVAVAVEFVPILALTAVPIVHMYEKLWASDYPKVAEHVALPPAGPEPGSMLAGIGLRVGHGAEALRLWMLTEDEAELLQLQHDRLILNWRKLEGGRYPAYASLRKKFSRRWEELGAAVSEFGQVRPTVAEVTFVNTVASAAGWAGMADVLATSGVPTLSGNCVVSAVQYVSALDEAIGGPGQIVVTAGHNGKSSVTLNIVTRLSITGTQITSAEILDRLDKAHDLGVQTFVALTPPDKHTEWGRIQ
jgi:uncharacterized protein (TIGR04255 family)